jgi:hypothetical protein
MFCIICKVRASVEQDTNQKSFDDFGPIFVFKCYELTIKVQPWLVSFKSKATDLAQTDVELLLKRITCYSPSPRISNNSLEAFNSLNVVGKHIQS